MSKVERRIIAMGQMHEIKCAVLKDGETSPASSVLDAMSIGKWENFNSPKLPDDMQIELCDELFALCEYFAEYGEPVALPDINQLEYGVWEFRTGWLRASFYDTDGVGGYTPKITKYSLKNQDWDEIPYFDPDIRLATCLSKSGRTARQPDVKYTRQIRQEDISHDKTAE